MTLLRTVTTMMFRIDGNTTTDGMGDLTDCIQVTRHDLDNAMNDLLTKVHFLRTDFDEMERSAKIVEGIGVMDDAVTMASAECSAL